MAAQWSVTYNFTLTITGGNYDDYQATEGGVWNGWNGWYMPDTSHLPWLPCLQRCEQDPDCAGLQMLSDEPTQNTKTCNRVLYWQVRKWHLEQIGGPPTPISMNDALQQPSKLSVWVFNRAT